MFWTMIKREGSEEKEDIFLCELGEKSAAVLEWRVPTCWNIHGRARKTMHLTFSVPSSRAVWTAFARPDWFSFSPGYESEVQ